jgi:hypothetical protein
MIFFNALSALSSIDVAVLVFLGPPAADASSALASASSLLAISTSDGAVAVSYYLASGLAAGAAYC